MFGIVIDYPNPILENPCLYAHLAHGSAMNVHW